eukprot:12098160-Alexandrium_andersonii.AAC.1
MPMRGAEAPLLPSAAAPKESDCHGATQDCHGRHGRKRNPSYCEEADGGHLTGDGRAAGRRC